jgi:hypothetical protein
MSEILKYKDPDTNVETRKRLHPASYRGLSILGV